MPTTVTITGVDPGSYVAPVLAPAAGTPETSAQMQIMTQALANQTQHLNHVVTDGTYTITCDTVDAATANLGVVAVTTSIGVSSPGIVTLQGGTKLEVFGRSRGRSLVALPDSTPQTIDTTQGDEFVLPNTPTAGPPIVIKLRDTAPIPLAQERLRFIVRDCGAAAISNGGKYEFRRETSNTLIATFIYPQSGVHVSIWAEFVLDGATYHLSTNSGGAYDSVPNFFGVMPGIGA